MNTVKMNDQSEDKNLKDTAPYLSAPQWAKFRSRMLKSFPSPYRAEKDSPADGIDAAIRKADK